MNTVVEIPKETLRLAERSAESFGLPLPDLIRDAITYYAKAYRPLELSRLNAETLEAMGEPRTRSPRFDSVEALMADLNAPD